MVSFFESETCLSFKLAAYFGEIIKAEKCGHCSVCLSGKRMMEPAAALIPVTSLDLRDLTEQFTALAKDKATPIALTRFLCGITSPIFTQLKASKMRGFGSLEEYPFSDVMSAVMKEFAEPVLCR